jgi:O-methyltransferase
MSLTLRLEIAMPIMTSAAGKEWLLRAFLALPSTLSRPLYDVARQRVFRDPRDATWRQTFRHVAGGKISGDYLEFGVYRGTSFISAYKHALACGLSTMRFFAYDSFEGLPNGEGAVFRQGDFAAPEALFRRMIGRAGVDLSRCVITRGFYSDTLTSGHKRRHALRRAAIVHVDCDLYTSTRDVLRYVEDLLVPGSIVIFDDWYAFRNPETEGEGRAFSEWSLRSRFVDFFDGRQTGKPTAKAFVLVR